MFTANSMNCLTEALGLSLPGNGSMLATHADRKRAVPRSRPSDRRHHPPLLRAGRRQRAAALDRQLRGVRERHEPRHRHGRLHQHRAAPPGRRPRGRRRLHHGRHRPAVAPRARACARSRRPRPTCTWKTSTAPAASWRSWASSTAPACSAPSCRPCTAPTLGDALDRWDVQPHATSEAVQRRSTSAAPGGVPTQTAFSQDAPLGRARSRPRERRHPRRRARLLARMAGWPCSTATSPLDGCIVKTAGVDDSILVFAGPARVFESQDAAVTGILQRQGRGRRRGGDPLRGPARRPGHAGDALPDQLPEIEGPGQSLRADHRRPLLRRHLGPVHRPRLARSGRGRPDRPGRGRRPDRDRHPQPRPINLAVSDEAIAARRAAMQAKGDRPGSRGQRERKVSTALRAYAAFTTSAARGAVRDVDQRRG